jgi:protein TonB
MKDKKILVVDFDEESLISLSNLVFEEGFQAVTALDGLSGYEKFKAEDFDLIIIEPMLPKLHGFELMKRINQNPGKKPPIMIVTGIYREPSCKMEALQVYGASAYFTKPWNKDDLRSKMLSLLADGQDEKPAEPQPQAKKPEPQAKKPEPVQPSPVKAPTAPLIDEWGLLKPQAPAHEPKANKGLGDLERELRAVAASAAAAPTRRKEPVKEAPKEKREAKAGSDMDIEAMLKTAIGGLGLEDKKRKPEHAVRPAPVFKPEPRVEKPEKKEKITIAKEIKERIPLHDNAGNNIPHPSARASAYAEKAPFGIDQTLIEIDKIPLEMDKPAPEPERPAPEKPVSPRKKAYFDEYAEPEKKKPPVALIGGLAAAVLVAAGATFMVLKAKKAKEPEPQMVSSLRPSLPDEFALRQKEIGTPRDSRENESKPDPKRTQAKDEQADALEIAKQIQPALPTQNSPVGMQIQLPASEGSDDQASEQTATPKTDNPAPTETPAGPPAETPAQVQSQQPEATTSAAPAVKPNPGDLLPLDRVDIAPALIKRVDPKYPLQAFNMGISGTVIVNALISETGDVLRTEILKGVKGGYGFEKAAETAVRQWKFRPAEKGGIPVRVWKSMDINFKMSPTPKR